jgi:uncharacterized phiE125 gp8 family phage protein
MSIAVTLAEAKEYIRVTSTDSTLGSMIQLILDGAEDVIAKYCGTRLSSTVIEEIANGGVQYFSPGVRPVTAVTSIYHADAEYNYGADEWIVRDARIYPAYTGALVAGRWPRGTYYLTYTAGYSTVPAGMKQAILLLTARMFDNRGGLSSLAAGGGSQSWSGGIAPGSDLAMLLDPYVSPSVVGR